MIQLSGIFSESLGGTCTIRGYAKYNEIVELSYPHPGYQRPAEDEHVAEISSFITSGSNSFSPEVVLAYTAKYNYYAQGASSEVDALADIRSGKGFTSNVDGIAFKKEKAAGNGFLYTLSIPDKKYDRIEDKPFRRVDGNHRLLAIEKLIAEGQMRSNYDIDKRLQQLNRSECIPFAFRVYATYEVNSRLSDLKILDCGNEHRIEEEISAIYKAHTEDGLSIVDLEARIPGKGYKAYHVDKECKLSIICFDEHINVDQPRIVLRGREEKRIYTAIDLMYMLMFSSEVSQIAEFDSDEKNSESQVLSWGGASDYFTHYYGRGKKAVDRRFSSVLPTF